MKSLYSIQIIELRFHVDRRNSEKIPRVDEYKCSPDKARLFNIGIRHMEIKRVSDGIKNTESLGS